MGNVPTGGSQTMHLPNTHTLSHGAGADRGAVTIVEPSRSWSHCHDRGAIVIFLMNRQSIDDRVDRKITIGCLFHGACWGAISLPNSGMKSSVFHAGPLAVEIVLDLHGSHENFHSR